MNSLQYQIEALIEDSGGQEMTISTNDGIWVVYLGVDVGVGSSVALAMEDLATHVAGRG